MKKPLIKNHSLLKSHSKKIKNRFPTIIILPLLKNKNIGQIHVRILKRLKIFSIFRQIIFHRRKKPKKSMVKTKNSLD